MFHLSEFQILDSLSIQYFIYIESSWLGLSCRLTLYHCISNKSDIKFTTQEGERKKVLCAIK